MGAYKKQRLYVKKRFVEIRKRFGKLFYYGSDVDAWLCEMIFMPYISLQWRQDPTWYRVIAPPGSGKSKHLEILKEFELTYVADQITTKSLISGHKNEDGEEVSQLLNMDGKVVLITDESTLMEQRQEDRNEIQAQLRKAYDGDFSKAYGNKKEVKNIKSRFNVLIGSTPEIDRYFLYMQALGERYINFRLQTPDKIGMVNKSLDNLFRGFNDEYDKLKELSHEYLRNMPDADISDVEFPDKYRTLVKDTAMFIARIRTRVTRDSRGRHITTIPQTEIATRLVRQMAQTAIANAIVWGDKAVGDKHISRAIYIAMCSTTAMVIYLLYNIWTLQRPREGGKTWWTISDLTSKTGLTSHTIKAIVQDLVIHRAIQQRSMKGMGRRAMEYSLGNDTIDIIHSTGLFDHYLPPLKEIIQTMEYKPKKSKGKKNRWLK